MVHLGRVGEYTFKKLRAWEISRQLGVYITEEGIEEAMEVPPLNACACFFLSLAKKTK
jgi:hypothetical protein